jgi:glycosyltransferase involved in cell wall biosynthesis
MRKSSTGKSTGNTAGKKRGNKPVPSNRIDIVIPVYNEGKNILRVLAAFEREVKSPLRLLICYDHEDDTTLAALAGVRTKFEIVPVRNRGRKAHGAVRTGLAYGRSPVVITYMADDDYNAGLIDRMVEKFRQGCEVVVPSRFLPGGSLEGCRWYKALPLRIAAWTLAHLARFPAHDPTNAFRLFSRRLLDAVTIESSVGFTFSIELTAKCHRLGWKICEIPARWFERNEGKSRFHVFDWAGGYLRWYFYIFATTYLRRRSGWSR